MAGARSGVRATRGRDREDLTATPATIVRRGAGAAIAGVVGFHSGLATVAPQDAKNIKGKVLVCIGADDPSIPPDQRSAFEREMREGRVAWQMNIYGGVVHSFTNPQADQRGQPERARYVVQVISLREPSAGRGVHAFF